MTSKAPITARSLQAILEHHAERIQKEKAQPLKGHEEEQAQPAAETPAAFNLPRAKPPAKHKAAPAVEAEEGLEEELDLFIATGRAAAPRDELATMEHPFYAIEDGDQRIIKYEHNGTSLEITPSVKGRATIHDKDIILVCVSKIVDAVNRGEPVSETVCITAHDILKFTGRSTSGRGYDLLEQALDRLAGTRIKTTVPTGKAGQRQRETFGLIDKWKTLTRGKDNRLEELRITLSKFTYDAALALQVLSIDPGYFKLRKATEKRLYELGRKHCGEQARWKIGLDLLHKKVGTRQPLYKFRHSVRGIIDARSLPGYHLAYSHLDDTVTFFNHSEAGLEAMTQALAALPAETASGTRPRVRARKATERK